MYKLELHDRENNSTVIVATFDTINQSLSFKYKLQQHFNNNYTYLLTGPDILELTT